MEFFQKTGLIRFDNDLLPKFLDTFNNNNNNNNKSNVISFPLPRTEANFFLIDIIKKKENEMQKKMNLDKNNVNEREYLEIQILIFHRECEI
jgi:hypothetical protein